MANIKYGPIVADIRGSIAGTCFSRGAGGPIARNAPKPCNPKSALQNVIRAGLARLTQYWGGTLEEVDRQAWRDYAAATSWTNRVGTAANVSGLSAFVRLNSLRIQAGLPIQESAPGQSGHAGSAAFEITTHAPDQQIIISNPGVPYDDTDVNNVMLFFQHGPTSAGRISLPSMKRFAGAQGGVAAPPSKFPLTLDAPITFSNGQNVAVAGILIDALGRVGSPFVARVLAANP